MTGAAGSCCAVEDCLPQPVRTRRRQSERERIFMNPRLLETRARVTRPGLPGGSFFRGCASHVPGEALERLAPAALVVVAIARRLKRGVVQREVRLPALRGQGHRDEGAQLGAEG